MCEPRESAVEGLRRGRGRKARARAYPPGPQGASAALREASAVPGLGPTMSLQAAREQWGELIEGVAGGPEVTLLSGGLPKALMGPVAGRGRWPVFTGTWEHLGRMGEWLGGATSEGLVRADRDGRG